MEKIVIVGYGGHAKSVADCIKRIGLYQIEGYTDLEEHSSEFKYLGTDDNLQSIFDSGVKKAVVGVGYLGKGELRQQLYAKLKEIGFELPVIIDPSAIVSDTAIIGEGTVVGKCAVVNAEARIGRMTILNTMSLVEHECIVEDFSHIAVGTVLCGQVKVGKAAFVGANATIIQCKEIKQCEIIPAGTTIR